MDSETVVSDHCTASEEFEKKVEFEVKKIETEKVSATNETPTPEEFESPCAADPVTESFAKIEEKKNEPIAEDSVRLAAESTERNIEDKTIDAPPSEEEKKTEVKNVEQVAKVTETQCDEEFKVELVEENLPKIVDVHESSSIEEVEVKKLKDDFQVSEPEEISKSCALVEERTVEVPEKDPPIHVEKVDDVEVEPPIKTIEDVKPVEIVAVGEISESAQPVEISQVTETTIHKVEEETEIVAIDEVKSDSVESQVEEKVVECSPIVEFHKVIETEAETETPLVQSQEKSVEPENIEKVSGEIVVEAGETEIQQAISQEKSVELPTCEKIEAESEILIPLVKSPEESIVPESEKITGVPPEEKSIEGESLPKSEELPEEKIVEKKEAECEIPQVLIVDRVEVETPIKLVEEEETAKVVIESSNEVKSDAIKPQVQEKDVECSPIVEVEEKSEEKVVDTSKIEAETEIPKIKYAEECFIPKELPTSLSEEKTVEVGKIEAETEIPQIESQEESVVAEKLPKYEEIGAKVEIEAETKIQEAIAQGKSVAAEELNKCEEQNPIEEVSSKDIELVPENGKKGETQVVQKLEESTKEPPKTAQIDQPVKTEQVNEEPVKDCEETKTSQDAPKKQSNNIMKMVKHSLVKAKKAIIGKSQNSKSTASELKEDAKE